MRWFGGKRDFMHKVEQNKYKQKKRSTIILVKGKKKVAQRNSFHCQHIIKYANQKFEADTNDTSRGLGEPLLLSEPQIPSSSVLEAIITKWS